MDPRTIRYLSLDQCRRLFREAKKRSKRDYALFLLAYRHALRASEVGALRLEDADLASNRLRFSRLKGSMGGDHPLRPDEAHALSSYLRTRKDDLPYLFPSNRRRPISRYTLDHLMKKYGQKARIPRDRRYFQVLKHSIAVHLVTGGADVLFVREWLGHRSIENTFAYVRLLNVSCDAERFMRFGSDWIA